jgi:outer membrane protein assembly factor BamA
MIKQFVFIASFLLCSFAAIAQNILLKTTVVDAVNIYKIIPLKTSFDSKTACINYIYQLPILLKSKGYITASIDTIIDKEKEIDINLFIGNLYTWKNLQLPSDIKNIIFNTDIETLPQTILNYYENNGYPFAKMSFDSVTINNQNEIAATLKVDKGIVYKMDSIRVLGNLNISNKFLQHYLKLPNNSFYSKEKFEQITNRINQLPFINTYKNWDILMLSSSYLLNLYLQPKNTNKFDAIIGFLPSNNKLQLTLDAKLHLQNAFARGESISLNWQQIQPQSPRIDIGFALPYIFNSDAAFSFNFNLYKRDSAYLNVTTDVGAEYELTNKTKFKIFISNLSTHIIQTDTNAIISTKKLPSVLDMTINNLGVEFFYNNTIGTKNNKRKGFDIRLTTSFGQKTIKPNTTITSLKTGGYNYNSLYDSINTNSYQVKAKIVAAKYITIGKQAVLKLAANYGFIQTKNYLRNELFQIGGFKLLRGFDEENIFTNEYIIGSSEYRYLINNNSYFFGFVDGGFTKNNISHKDYNYLGAGLGLALDTKQGLLNISFAAGKRNDLPFNLRETKIHVGIVSNF